MTTTDDLRSARATYYEASLRLASATGRMQRRAAAGTAPTPAELEDEQEARRNFDAAQQRYLGISTHAAPAIKEDPRRSGAQATDK